MLCTHPDLWRYNSYPISLRAYWRLRDLFTFNIFCIFRSLLYYSIVTVFFFLCCCKAKQCRHVGGKKRKPRLIVLIPRDWYGGWQWAGPRGSQIFAADEFKAASTTSWRLGSCLSAACIYKRTNIVSEWNVTTNPTRHWRLRGRVDWRMQISRRGNLHSKQSKV